MSEGSAEYREHLVEAHQAATRDFDRAVLLLAGGAFGVSMAFVRDFVPLAAERVDLLIVGWVSLVLSLLAILVSHLTSMGAALNGIDQLDGRTPDNGFAGWAAKATTLLNAGAAIGVVSGYGLLAWFAGVNLT